MPTEKAKKRSSWLAKFVARRMAKMKAAGWDKPTRTQFTKKADDRRNADAFKYDKPGVEKQHFFNEREDTLLYQGITRLLVGKSYYTKEKALAQMERADWSNTDRRLKVFTARFLQELRRRNVAMYPHSAYRTREEQNDLKKKGRSRNSWPRAAHCQGKAVDIVHCRFHWDLTPQEWATIGVIGKAVAKHYGIEVEWGGDWFNGRKKRGEFDVGWDPAHWQLEDWDRPIRTFKELPKETITPAKMVRDYPYIGKKVTTEKKSEAVSPQRSERALRSTQKDR